MNTRVSLCFLTMDRFDISAPCITHNIKQCGLRPSEIEVLVADNGSTDARMIPFLESVKPAYLRKNKFNEGVARAQNQLMLRAKGDFICLTGSDIKCDDRWLEHMLYFAEQVPNPGIIGIKCGAEIPPMSKRQDVSGLPIHAHFMNEKIFKVFGTMLISRNVMKAVGSLYEGFSHYGCEDSDFNFRVNLAGFTSFYIPETLCKSTHLHEDSGQNTPYRIMKDAGLVVAGKHFDERWQMYQAKTLPIFVAPPALREPNEEEIDYSNVVIPEDMSKLGATP